MTEWSEQKHIIEWRNTVQLYLEHYEESKMLDLSERIEILKNLFKFLCEDIGWKKISKKLNKIVREKLLLILEYKKIGPKNQEFFRNVNEILGFKLYCSAYTVLGRRCAKSVNTRRYCHIHTNTFRNRAVTISETTGILPNVSFIISEYYYGVKQ